MAAFYRSRKIALFSRALTRSQVLHSPRPLSLNRLSSTSPNSPPIEYNWVDGAETLEDYKPGGYHPVLVGDVLNDRYHIVDKLGHGGYSTVWLARQTNRDRYVAVKVNTADAPARESKILNELSDSESALSPHPGRDAIPEILDTFELSGPNGRHTCVAMTPARSNMRDASFSRLFPLDVARKLAYGVTLGVGYLHSRGFVHGDVHLGNILTKLPSSFDDLSIDKIYALYGHPESVPITRCDGGTLPPNVPTKAVLPIWLGKYAEKFTLSDASPLLSDFGESFSPLSESRLGKDCHTPPAFRPPEATFEPMSKLDFSSDVWSLATAIWEIVGMKALFSVEYVPYDEIIAQHCDVLGSMPSEWWERWEGRGKFYHEDGTPRESYVVNMWPRLEEAFEVGVQKWRRRVGDEMSEGEGRAFLDLMRSMLAFKPEERIYVQEVLRSEWMVEWAERDYERR